MQCWSGSSTRVKSNPRPPQRRSRSRSATPVASRSLSMEPRRAYSVKRAKHAISSLLRPDCKTGLYRRPLPVYNDLATPFAPKKDPFGCVSTLSSADTLFVGEFPSSLWRLSLWVPQSGENDVLRRKLHWLHGKNFYLRLSRSPKATRTKLPT